MANSVTPTPGKVYFDGEPIGEYIVDGDFTLKPAAGSEGTDEPMIQTHSRTLSFSLTAVDLRAAARFFARLDLADRLASEALAIATQRLRAYLAGDPISPRTIRELRARGVRARSRFLRGLAAIDAPQLTPVSHLVKPSARRAGRRPHRRSVR